MFSFAQLDIESMCFDKDSHFFVKQYIAFKGVSEIIFFFTNHIS